MTAFIQNLNIAFSEMGKYSNETHSLGGVPYTHVSILSLCSEANLILSFFSLRFINIIQSWNHSILALKEVMMLGQYLI